ncbi:DUF5134 domain-containing protein [Streptomyces sp. ST2-7A]|uniref:DUF5134 domain-containing protein n=1 Tax=Streptomyces sp. ST2-7A TaxID=2907214 RepID=UPI001F1AAC37|nr:DUF5134 domain-containing protein [Streptomyces sp. ST2-7A]MCE7079324.1 DUF5134 domain-containing protein [Streptomyces sp. ST2-7A]
MHGATPVGWLMAVICAGTGLYCLLSAHRSTGGARQIAAVEGVMLLGMAVMALPTGTVPLPTGLPARDGAEDGGPPGWSAAAWAVAALFPAVALWPVLRPRPGAGHRAHHLLEGAAMGGMAHLWLLGGGHGGPVSDPSPVPMAVPAALVAAYFAGYALRSGSRLASSGTAPVPVTGRPPEMATACRIVTALAMVVMLMAM